MEINIKSNTKSTFFVKGHYFDRITEKTVIFWNIIDVLDPISSDTLIDSIYEQCKKDHQSKLMIDDIKKIC